MGASKTKVRARDRPSRPRYARRHPSDLRTPPADDAPRFAFRPPDAHTPPAPSQWSNEEEDALRKGVKKYGAGKWRLIQKDPHLSKILHLRSNVDLKVRSRSKRRLHADLAPRPPPRASPPPALPAG